LFFFSSHLNNLLYPHLLIPRHGSRYASRFLYLEGLAEGFLLRHQKHRLHCCAVLLLQDPGTPPTPSVRTLTSPIDRAILSQTLKERFAELLPEKIEQIKALRKYSRSPSSPAPHRAQLILLTCCCKPAGSTVPRSLTRSPSTKYMAVPVASSASSGRVRFSTLRRVSASAARPSPNARSFFPRPPAARSPSPRVSSGFSSPARFPPSSRSATFPRTGLPAPRFPSLLRS